MRGAATQAMSVHIVDDEQRRDLPRSLAATRGPKEGLGPWSSDSRSRGVHITSYHLTRFEH